MRDLLNELKTIIGDGRVYPDQDMSMYTSMRVGGKAKFFLVPGDADALVSLIKFLRAENYPYYILGNGSNVIVRDGGYEGAIIQIGGDFREITITGNTLTAESGALLSYTASQAAASSLSGFEQLSGIPGSIGGALYMNAGAYDKEMKDIVSSAKVYDVENDSIVKMSVEDMQLSYRNSIFQQNNFPIIEVEFSLAQRNSEEILQEMHQYTERRNTKQPMEFASSGSFFKRPTGSYAGMLIEQAGLKGRQVGGAMVSEKHAGFIVNTGDATATDVVKLMQIVINKVKDNSGYVLEPEPRLIGEDAVGRVYFCGGD